MGNVFPRLLICLRFTPGQRYCVLKGHQQHMVSVYGVWALLFFSFFPVDHIINVTLISDFAVLNPVNAPIKLSCCFFLVRGCPLGMEQRGPHI